jgi:hypothetical protein
MPLAGCEARGRHVPCLPASPRWRQGTGGMDFQEKHKLKERIIKLKLEHHDLDMAISRLADDPTSDELQLTRLKKRKLQLKDTISKLQSMLIPDLDA